MPLFTYRATNDDNKEVRGSIDSPDLINARKALEDQHLDVIEIAEASRTHEPTNPPTPPENLPVFAFEGTDSAGTVRRGAMQATNKYEAFKRLRDDQKLFLTMLSPVGVLPKFNDPELDQWQRGAKMGVAQSVPVKILPSAISSAPPTATPAPRPTIGFTNVAKEEDKPVTAPKVTQVSGYHPLAATLRLYAGWLLAWYGFFVAIGYYSVNRALPWDIPFVQAFYLSPLIFSFMVAIFIFLMLSTVHRTMKGGLLSGLAFTVLGVTLFFGVKMLA